MKAFKQVSEVRYSGGEIDDVMHEFLEDLRADVKPKAPLYFCKLTAHQASSWMVRTKLDKPCHSYELT